jgi:hypothetical protein
MNGASRWLEAMAAGANFYPLAYQSIGSAAPAYTGGMRERIQKTQNYLFAY